MLITALDTKLPDSGELASIVYIPEGTHTITPSVGGKPQTIVIKMDAERGDEVAARFQGQLDSILAGNVRPFLDFDHKETGPAAALPKSFRYEQGKGLMLDLEWTGAGRKAIKSKDYSYFSPSFYKDDSGAPMGIDERGPLGSLVNSPAFRDIPRIAAAHAEAQLEPEKLPIMSKLIFAALKVDASHADAESIAAQKIEAMNAESETIKASLAAITTERDELTAKIEASNKGRAETLIKAAIADGRIASKDTDLQGKFQSKIESGDTFAEETLAMLPKSAEGIEKALVTAGADKAAPSGQRIEAAQSKARAELGPNANFDQVWARAADIDPSAFEG